MYLAQDLFRSHKSFMVAERLLDALLPETVPPLSTRSPTMDAALLSDLANEDLFIPTHIAGMPPLGEEFEGDIIK